MAARGRPSAASLAVVTALPGQRPEPPPELTDEQAEVWRAVVATKPADWFTADTHPLLTNYCRHTVTAAMVSAMIEALPAGDVTDEGVKKFNTLLQMRERESRAVAALARTMRVAQQSRYNALSANTAAEKVGGSRKPWEYGT
jgi:hypothetical protein